MVSSIRKADTHSFTAIKTHGIESLKAFSIQQQQDSFLPPSFPNSWITLDVCLKLT
jgi:hypothetical protein